jgi:hypothetical protein
MIIPEVIIYNTIMSFQRMMLLDYAAAVNKDDSILAQLFKKDDNGNDIMMSNYNYYKQATAILTRDVENSRLLQINLGYNMQTQGVPTINILMPNENKGMIDTIGHSEDVTIISNQTGETVIEKTRSNASIYYLMITSDNSSEVMIVYYWLKAMFLLFHENIELLGLRNMSHTGQDLNLQQDLAPPNIFHRNLSLAFNYESSAKMKVKSDIIKGMQFGVCQDFKMDFEDYMRENPQQA